MDRRGFLKTLGVAGATVVCPAATRAEAKPKGDEEPYGVLVDTTRCVGCNTCTASCAEANGYPEPEDPDSVHKTSPEQWTAVAVYNTSKGEVYVKRQCMHCVQPACGSACLTKAMYKTDAGPVVWRGEKCMGCRFCMVSCPFDMPKFEYHSANPRIRKCIMCADRVKQGKEPACVENCPAEALKFGKRSDLLRIAHKRIAENPDDYVNHVYGEREVGGTSWMYLAGVPFEEIGFRTDLGEESYPTLTTSFLYGVPMVLTLAPALFLAMSKAAERREGAEGDGEASASTGEEERS
jgi:formate dehydrogenase iron-sulfur subunit